MSRRHRDGQHKALGNCTSYPSVDLQQATQRMQNTLQLGLRSPSSQEGQRRWLKSDAGLQLQAVRAISAFVEALSKNLGSLSCIKVPLEEVIGALEGLLDAESEPVFTNASDVSFRLVALLGSSLNGIGGERLVIPLVSLLSHPKLSATLSAATALKSIIEKSTRRHKATALNNTSRSMWKLLEASDALGNIISLIESAPHVAKIGGPILTALTELLAVILERWPKTRYTAGSRSTLREIIYVHCSDADDTAVQAALRASISIAYCAGVTGLIKKDPRDAWSAIKDCLNCAKKCSIRVAALHLFALLGGFSTFESSIGEKNLDTIIVYCVRAVEDSWVGYKIKRSSDMELLAIEAADAFSMLLLCPGRHHVRFLRAGVVKFISQMLLLPCVSTEGNTLHPSKVYTIYDLDSEAIDVSSSIWKENPQSRILLWEAFGWLGSHCRGEEDELFKQDVELAYAFNKLASLACNYVVRTVIRRGQRHISLYDTHSCSLCGEGQRDSSKSSHITDQEVAQMCKTALVLISSKSQYCSTTTRFLLDYSLQHFRDEPFTFLLDALGLGYKDTSKVKSEKVLTLTRLWALSALSYLPEIKKTLLSISAANVIFNIIKEHHKADVRATIKTGLSSISDAHGSNTESRSKDCCSQVTQKWEGDDDIFFAGLWAFARLFQGSDWAEELTESLWQHDLFELVKRREDDEVFGFLWKLAGNTNAAAGVRWWASSGLACLGIYGFPSKLGESLKKLLNDSTSSDLTFVFADGNTLHCHAIILLARCPSLLPSALQTESSTLKSLYDDQFSQQAPKEPKDGAVGQTAQHSVDKAISRRGPVKVQVSARLSCKAVGYSLEFIYAGIAQIDAKSLPGVKLLAKRCELRILFGLLNCETPTWGAAVPQYSLGCLLQDMQFFDILLEADTCLGEHGSGKCRSCKLISDHVHAHRLILSSQCEYFQALFRSGMRDSTERAIQVHKRKEVVEKVVHYLYCREVLNLPEVYGDCAWNHLDTQSQLLYLHQLVELVELAEEWLLGNLQKQCYKLIMHCARLNLYLCPKVMSHAAISGQRVIVQELAKLIAPLHTQMRDFDAFDNLEEPLKELVRTAHVRMSLTAS